MSLWYFRTGIPVLHFWISYLLNNVSIPLCWEQVHRETEKYLAALHKAVFLFSINQETHMLKNFWVKKASECLSSKRLFEKSAFYSGVKLLASWKVWQRPRWRQLKGWEVAGWCSTGDVSLCVTLDLGTGRCDCRVVLAGRGVAVRGIPLLSLQTGLTAMWCESWF